MMYVKTILLSTYKVATVYLNIYYKLGVNIISIKVIVIKQTATLQY